MKVIRRRKANRRPHPPDGTNCIPVPWVPASRRAGRLPLELCGEEETRCLNMIINMLQVQWSKRDGADGAISEL